MSHFIHGVHAAKEGIERLGHTKDPGEGAVAGALAVAGTTAAGLATVGLMLTPVGWLAALAAGAAGGAALANSRKKK